MKLECESEEERNVSMLNRWKMVNVAVVMDLLFVRLFYLVLCRLLRYAEGAVQVDIAVGKELKTRIFLVHLGCVINWL